MFANVKVNGWGSSLLWKFLKSQFKEAPEAGRIKGNWTKFLVNHRGKVVGCYEPKYELYKIRKKIIRLINGNEEKEEKKEKYKCVIIGDVKMS